MSPQSVFVIRRAHKILALVVGAQFLFWTASGLFFTIFPIEKIRGEHLVHAEYPGALGDDAASLAPLTMTEGAQIISLKPSPFGAVYEVRTSEGHTVYDARTGEKLTPWQADKVSQLALSFWKGDEDIQSVDLIDRPPREAGSESAMWRIEMAGRGTPILWIDPNRVTKPRVRTTNWRIFDILWRFHIMDITGDDRFDSWWLRMFAFLGLTTVLFGIALLIDRARRGALLK